MHFSLLSTLSLLALLICCISAVPIWTPSQSAAEVLLQPQSQSQSIVAGDEIFLKWSSHLSKSPLALLLLADGSSDIPPARLIGTFPHHRGSVDRLTFYDKEITASHPPPICGKCRPTRSLCCIRNRNTIWRWLMESREQLRPHGALQ